MNNDGVVDPAETDPCNADTDGDGSNDDVDCNGRDENNWDSCATCLDGDTDNYYAGCDAYITINGEDCDDMDRDNWNSCATCLDTDTDSYYDGCDRYVVRPGPDCNDGDSAIKPGVSEILCDNVPLATEDRTLGRIKSLFR